MINVMIINFSQVIHLFLIFKTIQCTASKGFYLVLTVSGELKEGWVAEAGGRQDDGFKK